MENAPDNQQNQQVTDEQLLLAIHTLPEGVGRRFLLLMAGKHGVPKVRAFIENIERILPSMRRSDLGYNPAKIFLLHGLLSEQDLAVLRDASQTKTTMAPNGLKRREILRAGLAYGAPLVGGGIALDGYRRINRGQDSSPTTPYLEVIREVAIGALEMGGGAAVAALPQYAELSRRIESVSQAVSRISEIHASESCRVRS